MSGRHYRITMHVYVSNEVHDEHKKMPSGAKRIAETVEEWLYNAIPDGLPDGAITFHAEVEEVEGPSR